MYVISHATPPRALLGIWDVMFERDGVVTMTEKRPTPKHNGNLTLGLCAKVVGGRGERVTRQPGEGPMTALARDRPPQPRAAT